MPKRETQKISFKGNQCECYQGQLIVKVRPEIIRKSKERYAELIREILGSKEDFTVLHAADKEGMGLIELKRSSNLEAIAATLEHHKDIEFAAPNPVGRISGETVTPADNKKGLLVLPTDSLFGSQWNLQTINAPAAWSLTQGTNSVVIAVIDTGIPMQGNPLSLSHEDLNDPTRFELGTNYINPGTPPMDDNGHGTHVCGIAAASGNNGRGIAGIAWRCQVYIMKGFDDQGFGGPYDWYLAVQEAIAYAARTGKRLVINLSGGVAGYNPVHQQIALAVQNANALLCAAAGNDNGSPVIYPAAMSMQPNGADWFPNVMAVSNTTQGDTLNSSSNLGIQINLAAPGTDIISTMPNYRVTFNDPPYNLPMNYGPMTGTSMSTPQVSGVAALVWSLYPNLSAVDVRNRMQAAALDLLPTGRDVSFGFGRLDAFRAVAPIAPPPPPPAPPLDAWEDPAVRALIDEWIQQQQSCVRKVYPGCYIDRWGRMCGNTGSITITCNQNPDCPPGWTSYRYVWAHNWCPDYYPYRVRDYVARRQAGQNYNDLAQCKPPSQLCR